MIKTQYIILFFLQFLKWTIPNPILFLHLILNIQSSYLLHIRTAYLFDLPFHISIQLSHFHLTLSILNLIVYFINFFILFITHLRLYNYKICLRKWINFQGLFIYIIIYNNRITH